MKFNTGIAIGVIVAILLPSAHAGTICAKAASSAGRRLAARINTRIENQLEGNSWYIADKFRKLAQTRDDQGDFLLTVGEINSALMRSLTAFEYLKLIPMSDRDRGAILPFDGFQTGTGRPLEAADFISLLEVIPPYASGQDPVQASASHLRVRQQLGFELRKLTDSLKREELSSDAREILLDAELGTLNQDARRLRETLALILLETRGLIEVRSAQDPGAWVPLHVDYHRGPGFERFPAAPAIFRSNEVYPESPSGGVQVNGHTNGHSNGANGHGIEAVGHTDRH